MSDIVKLAEASAKANEHLRLLGMRNAYNHTAEERVASDAQYRLAQDAAFKADMDYRNAIRNLSVEQLSALVRRTQKSASFGVMFLSPSGNALHTSSHPRPSLLYATARRFVEQLMPASR